MRRVLDLAASPEVTSGEMASVSMRGEDGTPCTPWTSTEQAREIDLIQYELDQGPCVEAMRTGLLCNVALADPSFPWPDFASRSESHPVGSVLSTPLVVDHDVVGALNIYSSRAERFGEGPQAAAAALAGLAAAFLAAGPAGPERRWREAMATRDLVLRAEGVLMAWHSCSGQEAFAILRRTSQRDDRSLRSVAEDVLGSVVRPRP